MENLKFFKFQNTKARVAILMSGSGTNAEKLLESLKHPRFNTWTPSVIFTDAPKTSRAEAIAQKYHIPYVSSDIREFYNQHGEKRVSLATERGREIRQLWTEHVRELLKSFDIDFVLLAGFVPLTNLTEDYTCLNVHPGDLTCEKNGVRFLAGLHTFPIENAILAGHTALRSSVIIAQPYSGAGGEMDTGPILGISPAMPIDFQGHDMQTIQNWKKARPEQRPVGGYKDEFESLASYNQDKLKAEGDWLVFPPVVADFAAGKFAMDADGKLYYKSVLGIVAVKTVAYDAAGVPNPITL